MDIALDEAKKAFDEGEIPVGAVIVKNGEVIAKAHNQREKKLSALSHAECEAIRAANEYLGDWRLEECTMYVTLEPCMMCMGAIKNARIGELVYGAFDLKEGFCDSLVNISTLGGYSPKVYAGICEEECKALIEKFFKEMRADKDRKDR